MPALTLDGAIKTINVAQALSKLGAKAFKGIKKEMFAVEALLRGNYETYLRKFVDQYSRFFSIIDPAHPIDLLRIYVPLTVADEAGQNRVEITRFPDRLFKASRHCVIIDSAGMGKSTLAKFIFLKSVDEQKFLPVFVELRRLVAGESLLAFLVREMSLFKEKELAPEVVLHLLKSGLFLVVLDGVDEVSEACRRALSDGLKELLVSCPSATVLVTSRSDPLLTDFPTLHRWNILSLTRERAYQLIEQYEVDKELASRLVGALKERKKGDIVDSFIGTPLLVVLLVASYKEKQLIPTQRSSFYWQVYDALFEKHDAVKGGYVRERKCRLTIDQFHKVLRALCFALVAERRSSFEKASYFAIMDKARSFVPDVVVEPDKVLADLLRAVPLLLEEGSNYRFAHKSMIDYFAAEYACRDLKGRQATFLENVFTSGQVLRFSEMLRFCADIDFGTFRKSFLRLLAEDVVEHFSSLKAVIEAKIGERFVEMAYFTRLHLVSVDADEDMHAVVNAVREQVGDELDIDTFSVWFFSQEKCGLAVVHIRGHDFFKSLLQEQTIPFLYLLTSEVRKPPPLGVMTQLFEDKGAGVVVRPVSWTDVASLESSEAQEFFLGMPGLRVRWEEAEEFLRELKEGEERMDSGLDAFLAGLGKESGRASRGGSRQMRKGRGSSTKDLAGKRGE